MGLFSDIFSSEKFIDERSDGIEEVTLFKVALRLKINGMERSYNLLLANLRSVVFFDLLFEDIHVDHLLVCRSNFTLGSALHLLVKLYQVDFVLMKHLR